MHFFGSMVSAAALAVISISAFPHSSNAQTSSLVGEWVSQANRDCKIRITKASTSEGQLPGGMVTYSVVADNGPNCTWAAAGVGDDRSFSAGLRLFDRGLKETPTSGPLYTSFRLQGRILVMTSNNLDGSHRNGGFFEYYRPI